METLPSIINTGFILTTLVTFFLFYRVLIKSNDYHFLAYKISIVLVVWLLIQFLIASSDFYINNTHLTPPPFLLSFLPVLIFIIFLFNSKKGKLFIDSLPIIEATHVHIVRIPVEVILYCLASYKTIPELMTFTGRNFDIIAGLTAPIIAFYGIKKQLFNKRTIVIWNLVSLGLLIFIVVNAILSAPFTFQQFAFEQPNIAVFYFPYVWLPSFIVPIVLFCHLVTIRQLTKKRPLLTDFSKVQDVK